MTTEDQIPNNIYEAAEMLKEQFKEKTWFARIKIEEDEEDAEFDKIIVYTKNKRGSVGIADRFYRFRVELRKLRR